MYIDIYRYMHRMIGEEDYEFGAYQCFVIYGKRPPMCDGKVLSGNKVKLFLFFLSFFYIIMDKLIPYHTSNKKNLS